MFSCLFSVLLSIVKSLKPSLIFEAFSLMLNWFWEGGPKLIALFVFLGHCQASLRTSNIVITPSAFAMNFILTVLLLSVITKGPLVLQAISDDKNCPYFSVSMRRSIISSTTLQRTIYVSGVMVNSYPRVSS